MRPPLKRITVRGFKSITNLDGFELGALTVLIGANGAGKSNFIELFRLLGALARRSFQQYIGGQGNGGGLFFLGPETTPRIELRLDFGVAAYEVDLTPTEGKGLVLDQEVIRMDRGEVIRISDGGAEAGLGRQFEAPIVGEIADSITHWQVYHFYDTSTLALMRADQPVAGAETLSADGANIAAFLWHLRAHHLDHYEIVRDTVRVIAPFFDDFLLESSQSETGGKVRLRWVHETGGYPMQPGQLSDGTIRFICLAAALQQPELPPLIVVDEPELGLHPFALSVVADLIKTASEQSQVIMSTQSPTLLDAFDPESVVVVNRRGGGSAFDRLDTEALQEWLNEYSIGDLWQKNVVEGGPSDE